MTRCWRAVLDRRDGVPGVVVSIQTFGGYGANWQPHVHALATDGVLHPGGEFVPLAGYDETLERLLTWRHGGGFSAYARHGILNEEPARLAHIARYLVRPPVTADRVHATADGRVLIETQRTRARGRRRSSWTLSSGCGG